MSETIHGKIEKKTTKQGVSGERVTFKIGQHFPSYFKADKYMTDDVRAALEALQEGQEVEFTVDVNVGKDGRKYENIKGVTPIIQTRQESPEPPASTRTDTPREHNLDIEKIVGTSTSYAVPLYIKLMDMVSPDNEFFGVPDWETFGEIVEKISRAQIAAIKKLREE